MTRSILSKSQLQGVIFNNRHKLSNEAPFSYLPEITLLNKTAEEYGFTLKKAKAEKILKEIIKNLPGLSELKKKYEGAVLQIRGDFSVKPEFSMRTEDGFIKGVLFIFQETLTNRNHRVLAKKLIEEKAVELYPGCDEEYLYEALSEVTEIQLYETIKNLAAELPIFQVSFDADGTFRIKEMGKV